VSGHEAYANVAAYDLENPDGEWLLLLLHGLGGDRQQALGPVDGFRDPRLAILAPDLRGHGDTQLVGGPEAFTFEALVADILALVERLGQGSKPAYIAGISMGAALAIRLALGGCLDVRGLALVRPAFDDTPNPPNLAVMPTIAKLLQLDDAGKARAQLLASPEYREIGEITPSGAKSVEDQLVKPRARERAIRLVEVPKNVAWRDDAELHGLDVPALVVGTERDVMHPLHVARRTAALLPRAELVAVTPRDADPERYDREIRSAVQQHVLEALDASG
jgi:pimeloyl-ACP methyl ester carboxylesterase